MRVELLMCLSRELQFSTARPRSAALALEAVDVARRLGDPATLSRAISHSFGNSADSDKMGLEEMEERLGLANEAVELAEQAGDRFIAMTSRISRMVALLALGDISAMDRDIETFTRLAEELREPSWLWAAATFPAGRALLDGRMEDAERLAHAALAAGQRTEQTNATEFFGAQIFAIRREQARIAEMEPLVRGLMQQFPAIPAWRTAIALLLADLGREKEAREEFEILAADDFAVLPRDAQWPVAVALLAEVCGFLGDSERAAQLYEHLRPLEHICIVVGVATDCYGPTSRPMGRLAATMGRWDDAERHFEDALERSTKMGSGRWTTRTQLQYAQMLAARDGPGDRQKALGLLAQALETAPRMGLIKDMNDCLALKLQIQGISSSDINTSIDAVAREVLEANPDLRPQAAPDGTVTIMFSDIEGSTAMADRLGDKRFMDVLREHNAIIREQVKAHGGFEVKSEGDGFMVAFQSAGKALACASAIQKALVARNDSAAEPVKVRMGLHAGEVIKEGEDFFGRNVIMAARVASQANGGEILTSGVVKALLSGSDVSWGDSRTVALKGLSGEHEIWAVEWSGVNCASCGNNNPPPGPTHPPPPTPKPAPALPASFAGGRYAVKGFLGEGGRKRVYLAHDTKLDRDVAVAVIKTEGLDAAGLSRVQREAQAMGRLGDHPNIVTIHDVGDDAGQPYIVSQYMSGGAVDGLGLPLPAERTLDIAKGVCRGLAHAHAQRHPPRPQARQRLARRRRHGQDRRLRAGRRA